MESFNPNMFDQSSLVQEAPKPVEYAEIFRQIHRIRHRWRDCKHHREWGRFRSINGRQFNRTFRSDLTAGD